MYMFFIKTYIINYNKLSKNVETTITNKLSKKQIKNANNRIVKQKYRHYNKK